MCLVPTAATKGFGAFGDQWRGNISALAAAGFRVYAPTLPGFGRSEKAAVLYSQVHSAGERGRSAAIRGAAKRGASEKGRVESGRRTQGAQREGDHSRCQSS